MKENQFQLEGLSFKVPKHALCLGHNNPRAALWNKSSILSSFLLNFQSVLKSDDLSHTFVQSIHMSMLEL